MWRVADLTEELGAPFEVLEDGDFVELWCEEHGLCWVFTAFGVTRDRLVWAANKHRLFFHCADA